MTEIRTICIVGLGYVGLPTAVAFAEKGFKVMGADKKKEVIESLGKGICHLKEMNLDDRFSSVHESGQLRVTDDVEGAVRDSDAVIITVPTPLSDDNKPDLSFVEDAGRSISRSIRKGQLVVLESTVYPGATEELLKPILEESGLKAGEDFGLAHCPERLNVGDSVNTIERVNRVVGAINPYWGEVSQKMYERILQAKPYLVKDIVTAEATKIMENVQRDLNIGLMNEFAMIFELLGIDVMEVIKAASTKWNFNKYYPGPGVGGHCLPIDTYYLLDKADQAGFKSKIILSGRKVNDAMPVHVSDLLEGALKKAGLGISGADVLVLGVAYKENIKDFRRSPTLSLVEELKKRGARIMISDPFIDDDHDFLKEFGEIGKDFMSFLEKADAIVVMTAHDDYRSMDLKKAKGLMKTPTIIDGRRIFDPAEATSLGFVYMGIGAGGYPKIQKE